MDCHIRVAITPRKRVSARSRSAPRCSSPIIKHRVTFKSQRRIAMVS